MSSVSSTSTLASWDPMELLELVNPDKLSITCVGHAPSCRRRCRNPIAQHNIGSAKVVMKQMVRPGLSNNDLKELLFDLAGYTLCRRYHQGQARQVSDGWFSIVQRHREDEEDRGSDTSDDGADNDNSSGDDDDNSSTGSGDSDGDEANPAKTNSRTEQRRTLEDLERLQRELDKRIERQRHILLRGNNRGPLSSSTVRPLQSRARLSHTSEARRYEDSTHRLREEQEARREAEQVRQEEAYHRAQREREEARESSRRERAERLRTEQAKREEEERNLRREEEQKAEAKAKAKAKLESERLRREEAERARLDRERQAKERERQARVTSWEAAWLRYEQAWSKLPYGSAGDNTDVRDCEIWPTKSGSYSSCCEQDVKAFFRYQPGSVNRKMMRRQALRWHPDRAVRLFACVQDEIVLKEMMAAVTMISQVVIGIMGVSAR